MKGLDKVMKNLNKEIRKVEGLSQEGVLAAGLYVEAEATRNAPLLTGNLRGSAYTRSVPQGIGAEVGFEAEYAAAVHEIDKNYTVGSWKYLQNAIDENRDRILEIIRSRVKL